MKQGDVVLVANDHPPPPPPGPARSGRGRGRRVGQAQLAPIRLHAVMASCQSNGALPSIPAPAVPPALFARRRGRPPTAGGGARIVAAAAVAADAVVEQRAVCFTSSSTSAISPTHWLDWSSYLEPRLARDLLGLGARRQSTRSV